MYAFLILFVILGMMAVAFYNTFIVNHKNVQRKPKQNNGLRFFCIKDKGYHISVWPKNYDQFDVVEFNIAGLSYHQGTEKYVGEFVGMLKAEPDNPYDKNAIMILASDGHHVGYVPKDMTDEIRKNSTIPCPCFCYIGINNGTYFSDCYILRENENKNNKN